MENILITGGAGFIGSNFIHLLHQQQPGARLVNLDALTYAGSLENIREVMVSERHIFVQGSICDIALVDGLFQRYHIDTVVHFAAETHVDRSILGPGQFVQTNVVGTFTLLEAARKHWLAQSTGSRKAFRFHHVSTDEVYGSLRTEDQAWTEESPYAPNSPYSASKAASDHLVRVYYQTYGLPVTISNCSNNYGPRQFPEKLIPLMLLNACNNRALPVYGDGQQIRDWLYVEDHCEAILTILEKGQVGETYNIGGDNQTTNLSIVHCICDILDELCPLQDKSTYRQLIQYVTDRPGHDRRYAVDTRKMRRELDWAPRQSFREGLLKTVQWYLDHPEWIKAVETQGDIYTWIEQNYLQRGVEKG